MKDFNQLYDELAKKIAASDPESRTVSEYNAGTHAIGKKIVEEAAEVWMAAEHESKEDLIGEISQLIYHTEVLMIKHGITPEQIYEVL